MVFVLVIYWKIWYNEKITSYFFNIWQKPKKNSHYKQRFCRVNLTKHEMPPLKPHWFFEKKQKTLSWYKSGHNYVPSIHFRQNSSMIYECIVLGAGLSWRTRYFVILQYFLPRPYLAWAPTNLHWQSGTLLTAVFSSAPVRAAFFVFFG